MKERTRSCLLVFTLLLAGCAGRSTVQPRAEPALHWPEGHEWSTASVGALRSPATWIPAAAAAGIAVAGWDHRISTWAVENTPLFGSVTAAQNASNDLRAATNIMMIGTALFAPSQGGPILGRLARVAFEELVAATATGITTQLQGATQRQRPDGSGVTSFPSAHAARAFATAAMGSRDVDVMQLPGPADTTLTATMFTLASATGWARIEGGKHYPTDVLAAAALSDFVGFFMHDLFLGKVDVEVTHEDHADKRVVSVRYAIRF